MKQRPLRNTNSLGYFYRYTHGRIPFVYNPVTSAREYHCQQWPGDSYINYQSSKSPYVHAHKTLWQRHFLKWDYLLSGMFRFVSRWQWKWQNLPWNVYTLVRRDRESVAHNSTYTIVCRHQNCLFGGTNIEFQ